MNMTKQEQSEVVSPGISEDDEEEDKSLDSNEFGISRLKQIHKQTSSELLSDKNYQKAIFN